MPEIYSFERVVKDPENALVGTWQVPTEICECELAVVVFAGEGGYVMAEVSQTATRPVGL